jgi:CheY-like chemotaxis protein
MQMPGMDGLALASEIRQQASCKQLPLVMLTSIGKLEMPSQGIEPDFAAFLNKPIKQSQLYNVLVQIFDGQPVKVKPSHSLKRQLDPEMARRLPLRILVVEDNKVNQQLVLQLLEKMGYRADVAGNGLEAIQALRRQPYDVAFMDVHMPEMDGLTATQHICQEWPSTARPRIIAMTANAMQGDREDCLRAGMDDYISKPIRIEELVASLWKSQPHGEVSPVPPQELTPSGGEMPEPEPAIATALDKEILQAFRQAMGADASALLGLLIDVYLEETPTLLEKLSGAIVRGDADARKQAAHTLKSSSASLGATKFSKLCEELESMEASKTTAIASELVAQLESEYEKIKVELLLER